MLKCVKKKKRVTLGGLHNAGTIGDAEVCKSGYSQWTV